METLRRLFLGAGLALALGASGGGLANAATAPTNFVTVIDQSTPVRVSPGSYFLIALDATAGTGYGWSLVGAKPSGVVTALGNSYLQAKPPAARPGVPILGGSGTGLLLFRATHSGATTLTFGYSRPFEKGVKPARTAVFRIVVK